MTVEEIRKGYGDIDKGEEGIWEENGVLCECGGHVTVEVNYEEPGGYLGDNHECDTCHKMYKAAYTIEPTIIIEAI